MSSSRKQMADGTAGQEYASKKGNCVQQYWQELTATSHSNQILNQLLALRIEPC